MPISRFDDLYERLTRLGVTQVSYQCYWYDDETTIADIHATNADGQQVPITEINEFVFWELIECYFPTYEYGAYRLLVSSRQLTRTGEADVPGDDEDGDYNDEPEWDGDGNDTSQDESSH